MKLNKVKKKPYPTGPPKERDRGGRGPENPDTQDTISFLTLLTFKTRTSPITYFKLNSSLPFTFFLILSHVSVMFLLHHYLFFYSSTPWSRFSLLSAEKLSCRRVMKPFISLLWLNWSFCYYNFLFRL